jgi:hypothetical protein
LGYDVDAFSRAIDLAGKTPDAILFIRNNRHVSGLVPPHHIDKAGFDAGPTAGAFFSVDFNAGTHGVSKTEWMNHSN